jgi:hypothetical protein
MMAWETVERNRLTAVTETEREEISRRIAETLLDDLGSAPGVAGAYAIIGAAINYLAMRQRKIRIFSGVEIRTEEGWREMTRAIELMMAAFAIPAGKT